MMGRAEVVGGGRWLRASAHQARPLRTTLSWRAATSSAPDVVDKRAAAGRGGAASVNSDLLRGTAAGPPVPALRPYLPVDVLAAFQRQTVAADAAPLAK